MRVKKIALEGGASFSPSNLNVFIGPNNSGKTQALKDIFRKGLNEGGRTLVLEKVEFEPIVDLDANILKAVRFGQKVILEQKTDQIRGLWSNLKSGKEFEWHADYFRSVSGPINPSTLPTELKAMQFAHLEGSSRLDIVQQGSSHNPQVDPPQSLLQALFIDTTGAERKLSEAVKDAFGLEVRLDYSGMRGLCLRIAPNFDNVEADPRIGFSEMQQKPMLDSEGDGLRSYIAIVLAVLLCKDRIILIDEPEAFLHSSHQRKLGRWLSEQTSKGNYQIFVATHSASFLAGLIAYNNATQIVRIAKYGLGTTAKVMSSEQVRKLATSPLTLPHLLSQSL